VKFYYITDSKLLNNKYYIIRLMYINLADFCSLYPLASIIFFKEMVSKFYSGLSQDLSLMLDDSNDHDVIIQIGENQNMKEFRAHSNILGARSPYFKSAFSDVWITRNKNNMVEFQKPNINPNVFEVILK
jgi:hypothetical protein